MGEIAQKRGKRRRRSVSLPYAQAREKARALAVLHDLTSSTRWTRWVRKHELPVGVPVSPVAVYRERGWRGWSDWLGGRYRPMRRLTRADAMSFSEAVKAVRAVGLASVPQWNLWLAGKLPKKGPVPERLPRSPHEFYRDQWKGWGYFLGTGRTLTPASQIMPFDEARRVVRRLAKRYEHRGIATAEAFLDYMRNGVKGVPPCPRNIARQPQITYRKDWKGWRDFLGTG